MWCHILEASESCDLHMRCCKCAAQCLHCSNCALPSIKAGHTYCWSCPQTWPTAKKQFHLSMLTMLTTQFCTLL